MDNKWVTIEILEQYYISWVRPHLEYGDLVYDRANREGKMLLVTDDPMRTTQCTYRVNPVPSSYNMHRSLEDL